MDNIPDPDNDFLDMAKAFRDALVANLAGYGFIVGDTNSLTSTINAFETGLDNETAASNAFDAAHATKLTNRVNLEAMVRNFIQRIYAKPGISDTLITGAGLRVKDKTKTPLVVPDTAPVLFVATGNRLEHKISWRDSSTPDSRAKPKGAWGIKPWRKKGGPTPIGNTGCELISLIRSSPALEEYESTDGNTTIYYVACWADANGNEGPLSEVVAATVTC